MRHLSSSYRSFRASSLLAFLLSFVPLQAQPDTLLEQEWCTYWGGQSGDQITDIAVDAFGHIYVTGRTNGNWALATPFAYQDSMAGGASDAFLAKFAPHGSLLWSTYFGGPDTDVGTAIALDTMSFVHLIGNTSSDSLIALPAAAQPTRAGGQDAFIATFGPDGTLLRSTYAGGGGEDAALGGMVDHGGHLYVCGWTDSPDLFTGSPPPVLPPGGGTDGFVVRYTTEGAMAGHTYVGGAGNDSLVSLVTTDTTTLLILGNTDTPIGLATAGTLQAVAAGGADAFVQLLDTALLLIRGSYFGGLALDLGNGLAIDSGRVIICGTSWSDTLHTDTSSYQHTRRYGSDGYLAVLNDSLLLQWATFYGDSADEALRGVAIGSEGGIYVSGWTGSMDSIASSGTPQEALRGAQDAYVVKFDSVNTRAWSTYIGGTGQDAAMSIQVIGETAVIIAGVTDSPDSLALLGHQMEIGGGTDGWAARLQQRISSPCNGLCNGDSGPLTDLYLCEGDSFTLQVFGGALGLGASWMWYANDCGDPMSFIGIGDTLTYTPTVDMVVFVRAESALGVSSCASVVIHVVPFPSITLSGTDSVCVNGFIQLDASGGDSFMWSMNDSTISNLPTTSYIPTSQGALTFSVDVTAAPGCTSTDSLTTFVLPLPAPLWSLTGTTCHDAADGTIALLDAAMNGLTVQWDQLGSLDTIVTDLPLGTYFPLVTTTMGCSMIDTLVLTGPPPLLDSVSVVGALCGTASGSAAAFPATYPFLTYDWGAGPTAFSSITNVPPGGYTLIVQDTLGCIGTGSFQVQALGQVGVWTQPDSVEVVNGTALLNAGCWPCGANMLWTWSPSDLVSDSSDPTTMATVDSTTLFTIVGLSSLGCVDTAYVLVAVPSAEVCGAFFVPNIFSPNDDGLNDTFGALGGCFSSYALYIYDRWGMLLFHSTDPEQQWDGRLNGTPVSTGTCTVSITAVRTTGERIAHAGMITLLR